MIKIKKEYSFEILAIVAIVAIFAILMSNSESYLASFTEIEDLSGMATMGTFRRVTIGFSDGTIIETDKFGRATIPIEGLSSKSKIKTDLFNRATIKIESSSGGICLATCPEGTVTEINNCIFADGSCTGDTWCFDGSGIMTPVSCIEGCTYYGEASEYKEYKRSWESGTGTECIDMGSCGTSGEETSGAGCSLHPGVCNSNNLCEPSTNFTSCCTWGCEYKDWNSSNFGWTNLNGDFIPSYNGVYLDFGIIENVPQCMEEMPTICNCDSNIDDVCGAWHRMECCTDGNCNTCTNGGNDGVCRMKSGGGCFVADTLISTPKGQVPIQDLKVGDEVNTFVDGSGKLSISTIKKVYKHDPYDTIYGLYKLTTNNHEVIVTGEHAFAKPDKKGLLEWKPVHRLKIGNQVYVEDGKIETIISLEKLDYKENTYNFEIKKTHTYIANGFRVHNSNKDPPTDYMIDEPK